MIVVFASTAFIPTGLEVGAGAATAVVGQKLLETLFGDEAVRRMARVARERLTTRLDELVAERAGPFQERLDALAGLGNPAELAVDVDQREQLAQQIREERCVRATKAVSTPATKKTPVAARAPAVAGAPGRAQDPPSR